MVVFVPSTLFIILYWFKSPFIFTFNTTPNLFVEGLFLYASTSSLVATISNPLFIPFTKPSTRCGRPASVELVSSIISLQGSDKPVCVFIYTSTLFVTPPLLLLLLLLLSSILVSKIVLLVYVFL